jgi:UDP-2,4-diacetamido-2,4,6-trideoxy-beta-L-altropyranose hydrolase
VLNIAFRVDGGKEVGLGHAVRCLNLAQQLRETTECEITFISATPSAFSELSTRNYGIEPRIFDNIDITTDILVVDLPAINEEYLLDLRSRAKFLVNIDDHTSNVRFCSDILVRPNFNEGVNHLYSGTTRYLSGKDYIILGKQFEVFARKRRAIPTEPKSILVCFGGSDPENLTQRLIPTLEQIAFKPRIDLVLGASFSSVSEIEKLVSRQKRYSLHKNASNMAQLMWGADLAVISGGTLMYEACTLGTPAIIISQNQEQDDEARLFDQKGAIVYLGLHNKIDNPKIRRTIEAILSDAPLRRRLSQEAKKLIEPYGAERIAKIIIEDFNRKYV